MAKVYTEGSVYLRKDGRWVAKYKPSNSTKQKYVYGTSERDVKRKLKAIKEEESARLPQNACRKDLQTYLNDWLETDLKKTLKPKSYDAKEFAINLISERIGMLQVGAITRIDIQNLINKLADEGYSYSAISKVKCALNQRFQQSLLDGDLSVNPAVGVKLPKTIQKRQSDIRVFSSAELKKILDTATSKYQNGTPVYRWGYLFKLLAFTGMRVGEAMALTWSDVDLEERTIRIKQDVVYVKDRDAESGYKLIVQDSVKTESGERIIPISDNAFDALQNLKKLNGEFTYVAATRTGAISHYKPVSRAFEAIQRRAGITSLGTIHSLRHTFASRLIEEGTDVKVVSELLGHSSVEITYNIYTHIIQAQKVKAVSSIDSI